MAKIALIRISEYDDGSVNTLADAFTSAAEGKGFEVIGTATSFDKTCHCCGHCCQQGGEGCGDEDCICTFAKSVPDCSALAFFFPVDRGFSPTALNKIVHKVTFNCKRATDDARKKVLLVATSEMFDDIVFNDALSVIKLECSMKNWAYAGEFLVPGLPDACIGADPVSCRKVSRLTEKL